MVCEDLVLSTLLYLFYFLIVLLVFDDEGVLVNLNKFRMLDVFVVFWLNLNVE